MAELFGVERSVITKYLINIFESGEGEENSVSAKIAHTATDGKVFQTSYYNLDSVISVVYRVNSEKATHFRIWAIQTLREFIIKGFVLDDELLKNGRHFGKDYFEEFLERMTLEEVNPHLTELVTQAVTLCPGSRFPRPN